ncbi:MAG: hypothetical protein LBL06_04240 [Treponema sp.]|jgi:hypothetical protein|nr:hypothetical protein [Treponema sp.]
MVDRLLIDTLTTKSRDFAVRWKNKVRTAEQLKHYNALSDEQFIESHIGLYPVLARTLDRGLDRSLVGGFFVGIGKKRMKDGYPISEIIYAASLAQQAIIEYIMNEFVLDNPIKMYQAMGMVERVAQFFLLGCFYLTKGFLEATYTDMNGKDAVSETLLKKYFKDDFFFKEN